MNPAYLSLVANHLWQSTLFAGVAGLLTLVLRNNHARVRHGIWLAASCKFLIPLTVLIGLGGHFRWPTSPGAQQHNLAVAMEEVSEPFTAPAVAPPILASPPAASPIPAFLLCIWACGFAGFSSSWYIRWRRIQAVVRGGSAMQLALPIRGVSSPGALEPGVFGVFRPVLVLPEGIFESLTAAQFEAVVAHELCHVCHRDNLIAAAHMFVETLFWFHPLVWWIGKRMVEERERACDEEVLRLGSEPRIYAEGILNVCKLYVESPLACVSGVTGSNLKKRIAAIMIQHNAVRLTIAKKVTLSVAATAALAAPIIVGMMNAPAIRAQAPSTGRSAATPKFDVASVKPCKDEAGMQNGIGRKGEGGRGRPGGSSPGSLNLPCLPVRFFLTLAYIMRDARPNDGGPGLSLDGAPPWIDTERYQITAKSESPADANTMNGPMLQALLEERFRLKTHRETREVPMYALTVAKGGLKLQRPGERSCTEPDALGQLKDGKPFLPLGCSKLQRAEEGGCTIIDFTQSPRPPLVPGQKPPCGVFRGLTNPQRHVADLLGADMMQISRAINAGRPIIDKTGLTDKFDFHLEFAPEGAETSDDTGLPSIFTALGQLGLRLEAAKGPRDFLVIDHVERPSEN